MESSLLIGFLGSFLGSGLVLAVVNYHLDQCRQQSARTLELKLDIASLYDCIHFNQLPEDFSQRVSKVAVKLDAYGQPHNAKRIRDIVRHWGPGTIDTTELKQLLHDLLLL